jgi:hypothetical protein
MRLEANTNTALDLQIAGYQFPSYGKQSPIGASNFGDSLNVRSDEKLKGIVVILARQYNLVGWHKYK